MANHHEIDGMVQASGSKLVASSPLEKVFPVPVDCLELPELYVAHDHIEKAHSVKEDGTDEFSNSSMGFMNNGSKTGPNLLMQLPSYRMERSKPDINSTQYESSLFSSSFSDIFSRKLRFPVNDTLFHPPADAVVSCYKNEEPFNSVKELEASNIGNFLPDEDDLLSGMIDEVGYIANAGSVDDVEDFDLFSSGGGMELDGDEHPCAGQGISDSTWGISKGLVVSYGSTISEQPSRTIFVRNIDCSVEDSELRVLFEQFGDIWALFTACKNQGFVMISFYDIRAARNAMRALQNKPLRGRKLDMHYSILKDNPSEKDITNGTIGIFNLDSSVSIEDLQQIFGIYGEIREIRENLHSPHDKFIEFCDIRAAEAALRALNRKTVSGKQIKLEPGWPGGVSLEGASSGNKNGPPKHSQEPVMFGSNCIPSSHPHSLPEYHNYIGNIIPSNSLSTAEDMVNIGAKIAGDSRCIGRMVSNGQPVDVNGGVLGGFGNLSCPLNGHHCMRRNNSYQHHPVSSIVWPNSPTFINGIHAHCPPKLTGFPTVPPHMLNIAPPVHQHHVGSAPAVNPSIWDMQHAYAEKSSKASGFHLGSLGSLGFPVGSPLLPPDIASHNIFPHAGGNFMDMSPNSRLHSPQQMCHMFRGMGSIISSYGSPSEHARGFVHRRNDISSSYADKKQYELDIDRILHVEDNRTTLMIKNIPNKYTSKMLLAAIDEHHRGTYDFVYLPIDFKNKCNVGYAFINLIDPLQIVPFHQTFSGKKWEKFNSEKVATLAYARIQGKAALIAHFQNSSLMNEDKRCRPILFHTAGPNAGDQEPFPTSSNVRSRSGKLRSVGAEGIPCHGSPSSPNFEDPSNRADSLLDSTKHSD